jgi:carnosine N-methyltransferase
MDLRDPTVHLEERKALGRIVLAFRNYKLSTEIEVSRWEYNFNCLPNHQRILIKSQQDKFKRARQCVNTNSFFISSLLASFDQEDEVPLHLAGANRACDDVVKAGCQTGQVDIDKVGRCSSAAELKHALINSTHQEQVKYVLKNLARDWSAEGAAERLSCYGPILKHLSQLFGDW